MSRELLPHSSSFLSHTLSFSIGRGTQCWVWCRVARGGEGKGRGKTSARCVPKSDSLLVVPGRGGGGSKQKQTFGKDSDEVQRNHLCGDILYLLLAVPSLTWPAVLIRGKSTPFQQGSSEEWSFSAKHIVLPPLVYFKPYFFPERYCLRDQEARQKRGQSRRPSKRVWARPDRSVKRITKEASSSLSSFEEESDEVFCPSSSSPLSPFSTQPLTGTKKKEEKRYRNCTMWKML